MSYNICYFLGGTGARIAGVTTHMIASGYLKKGEDVEYVIVDKDYDCRSYSDAKALLSKYSKVREVLQAEQNLRNFYTPINQFDWSFSATIEEVFFYSGNQQDKANKATLADTLVSRTDQGNDQILLNGLYSKAEQDKPTERGFYGHPSIGALIFKSMLKHDRYDEIIKNKKEYDIFYPIDKCIDDNSGVQINIKVFIVGSIFGGTGAAVIPNLARYIKKRFDDKVSINKVEQEANNDSANNNNMKADLAIAGILVLPYFEIPSLVNPTAEVLDPDMIIKSKEFLPKTKISLEHYGSDTELLKKGGKGIFKRLYLVGAMPFNKTTKVYAAGAEDQKSHFDYIDLLAASSIVHFFNNEENDNNGNNSMPIYLFARNDHENKPRFLDWNDMPKLGEDTYKPFLKMLRFSSYLITVIHYSFVLGEKNVNIKRNNLMPKLLYKGSLKLDDYNTMMKLVENAFKYCSAYIEFLYDIAYNGSDWVEGKMNEDARLFRRSYIELLRRFCIEISVGDSQAGGSLYTISKDLDFDDDIVLISKVELNNTKIDNELIKKFSRKKYNDSTPAEVRVGEYLSYLLNLC